MIVAGDCRRRSSPAIDPRSDRHRHPLVGRPRAWTRGGMAEWPIAPVLKTGSLTASWVQIPVPPYARGALSRRACLVRRFESESDWIGATVVQIPVPPYARGALSRRATPVREFEPCESQRPSEARTTVSLRFKSQSHRTRAAHFRAARLPCESLNPASRSVRAKRGRPSRSGSNPSPTVRARRSSRRARLVRRFESESDWIGATSYDARWPSCT